MVIQGAFGLKEGFVAQYSIGLVPSPIGAKLNFDQVDWVGGGVLVLALIQSVRMDGFSGNLYFRRILCNPITPSF